MNRFLSFAAALLIASALQASAAVKPVDQFSADQIMVVRGQTMNGRIYVDRGNLRTEMQPPGMPEPAVSIINGAQKVVWIVMPGNMYMEKSIETSDDISHAAWTSPDKLESLGRETVDGIACEKFRLRNDRQELFYFIGEKDGLPVRMISADGTIRIDWRNVKTGPQPAHLFQLPAGATKFALPGGFKLPGMR